MTMSFLNRECPAGYKEIFVTRITLRNGRVLYASSYGLRAFRIFVKA
jgi:hypothetical protein